MMNVICIFLPQIAFPYGLYCDNLQKTKTRQKANSSVNYVNKRKEEKQISGSRKTSVGDIIKTKWLDTKLGAISNQKKKKGAMKSGVILKRKHIRA